MALVKEDDDNLKKELSQADINRHNEEINAAILELEAKKKKYDEVSRTASGINSALENLVAGATDVNTLLEQITINGEAMGSNVFSGSIRQQLTGYGETFTSIINECNAKITEIEEEINQKRLLLW